jgi:hypothetical protein
MAKGIFRIKDGFATEHSAWVRYDDANELEISETQYRSQDYEPPFEELPWGTKSTINA